MNSNSRPFFSAVQLNIGIKLQIMKYYKPTGAGVNASDKAAGGTGSHISMPLISSPLFCTNDTRGLIVSSRSHPSPLPGPRAFIIMNRYENRKWSCTVIESPGATETFLAILLMGILSMSPSMCLIVWRST